MNIEKKKKGYRKYKIEIPKENVETKTRNRTIKNKIKNVLLPMI